ncbi:AAA family ATPase [Leptospira idonii]|uniref:ATP-binding protein n=1 Tax=Leptospira idonii TaxID=1193500 RepID=A0A4R9LZK7_9LEPT|nr:AAA family ATPase [Leptospira idonii]TGN19810.1 ATP-binding protein [Leptospira idonii]
MGNDLKTLILLRGLPGSGKSSLAKILSEDGKYPVFSVDRYFTDPITGIYEFRYQENHLAYRACESDTRSAMENVVPKIFVDNTFTMEWEMKPYFLLASEYDYTVFTMTLENRHEGENIHGITDDQMKKMALGYQVELLPERLREK